MILNQNKGKWILKCLNFDFSGFFSHFTSELLTTDFDEERLKSNMKASQIRGLSDPSGSGIRRERLDELRDNGGGIDVESSISSPENFIESLED